MTDDGLGLKHPEHLFIPFFTTKPPGAGIGPALSRQIAEAHGGTLTLINQSQGPWLSSIAQFTKNRFIDIRHR